MDEHRHRSSFQDEGVCIYLSLSKYESAPFELLELRRRRRYSTSRSRNGLAPPLRSSTGRFVAVRGVCGAACYQSCSGDVGLGGNGELSDHPEQLDC